MSVEVLISLSNNCSLTEDELNRAIGIAAYYGRDSEHFIALLYREISGNKKVTQSSKNTDRHIKDITA